MINPSTKHKMVERWLNAKQPFASSRVTSNSDMSLNVDFLDLNSLAAVAMDHKIKVEKTKKATSIKHTIITICAHRLNAIFFVTLNVMFFYVIDYFNKIGIKCESNTIFMRVISP
jgi:hypothetical protein